MTPSRVHVQVLRLRQQGVGALREDFHNRSRRARGEPASET